MTKNYINNVDYNDYNHLTIFLFLIPLLQSYIFGCYNYLYITSIWVSCGFSYHYSLYKTKRYTTIVNIFRTLDIFSIHTLIPYIIYKSLFGNIYFVCGILCVKLLLILYYVYPKIYNIAIPHFIIHIIASCGVWFSINSCYINKQICDLC